LQGFRRIPCLCWSKNRNNCVQETWRRAIIVFIGRGSDNPNPPKRRNKMKLTSKVLRLAENVVVISKEDARHLPGILGRIVPASLTYHEYYSCLLDGKRTLYIEPKIASRVP
jgi:hypothetical protein